MSAGRGVFQPFIHEIDNRAQTLDLDGLPVLSQRRPPMEKET